MAFIRAQGLYLRKIKNFYLNLEEITKFLHFQTKVNLGEVKEVTFLKRGSIFIFVAKIFSRTK